MEDNIIIKKTLAELNDNLKNKVINYTMARFFYKGEPCTKEDVLRHFSDKKFTIKKWRITPYLCMRSIDTRRIQRGLEPLYNVL